MKIVSVVGARPNFIKIAPFIRAINSYNLNNTKKNIEHILVHTGQHYDIRMSNTFFKELGIPDPDINLEIGSGTHAEQVGYTMISFEKVLREVQPNWVVVVGDVNATLACSITAKKELINCCHIEAGLRSGDLGMPEEINRLVTDKLSDLLLTPDIISSENLRKEGVLEKKIVFVGNIMIDTLEYNKDKIQNLKIKDIIRDNVIELNAKKLDFFEKIDKYGLITLHRPSNVDNELIFKSIINWLIFDASKKISLIWPIHPRTVKQAQKFGLWEKLINAENLLLLYPLGYLEMLKLNTNSKIILTDSGGLQEECSVLGTPFLTLRWNTERPVTLIENGGTGYLVGNNIENIKRDFDNALKAERTPRKLELWDGNTSIRCLKAILEYK